MIVGNQRQGFACRVALIGFVTALSAFAITGALAEDIYSQPYPKAPSTGFSTPKPFDVLGISIGMPMDVAKQKLGAIYGKLEESSDNFSDVIDVANQRYWIHGPGFVSFIKGVKYSNNNFTVDSTRIYFSLPSSGAGVIGADRDLGYHALEDQPNKDGFLVGVKTKYGEPTYQSESDGRVTLCWAYNGTTPIKIDDCRNVSWPNIQKDSGSIINLRKEGVTLNILAEFSASDQDATRIDYARFVIVDTARYADDLADYQKILDDGKNAVVSKIKAIAPGEVPKL